MARVFCDLRSQKTPRGILPVNSNFPVLHPTTILSAHFIFFLPCPHYTAAGIRQQKEKKKNRKKVLLTALSYGSVCSFFHCFLHHEPSDAAGIFLYGSLCRDARFYAESFPRLIFPRGYS